MSYLEELLEAIETSLNAQEAALTRRAAAIARMQADLIKDRAALTAGRVAAEGFKRWIGGGTPLPTPPPLPPTPPPQPDPAPPPPAPPPAPAPYPDKFPGMGSAPHLRALREASKRSGGVFPEVIEAIEREETGNYEDPDAKAWLLDDNPGGMVYTKYLQSIGAKPSSYGGKYGRFDLWWQGILAHGTFLGPTNLLDGKPRYGAAYNLTDPYAQVDAIGAAGYAAGSDSWRANVRAHLTKVLARNPAPPAPVPAEDYLTPHFRISVDVEHQAKHPGNNLPPSLRPNALAMAHVLETIRSWLGGPLVTNSWYRSPQVNSEQAGSATHSKHLQALAVDVPRTAEMWAAVHAAQPSGLILQVENGAGGSHYHLELSPGSVVPFDVVWKTTERKDWEK